MDQGACHCITGSQAVTCICPSACALQSKASHTPCRRCLQLRDQSSALPSSARRVRTPCCFCFSCFVPKREKLHPVGKGGFVADLWDQQVPQIYLYSRHFTLVADHRLLTAILGPKTGVPSLAAARLQSWALALSTYSYTIEFWSTKAHANTDGLSRLLLPLSPVECSEQPSVESALAVSQMLALPTSVAQLRRAT